jgi:hypothetical protein
MQTSSFNDLIGLQRAWAAKPGDGSGTVDCCLLAAEVHKRLGYHDYAPDFAWFFERYTDETFPRRYIAKWLLQNGERLTEPEPHAVVLLPGLGSGAMGTVMDDGTVLFIGKNGVIRAPLPSTLGHYFRLKK